MLDGLEIQEILLSSLERTNRIDAEFYRKTNIIVETVLEQWEKKSFVDCFNVSDGNHMSISEYFSESGIPYYRGQDIYNIFIENAHPNYITQEAFDKPLMHRSHLKKDDILLSIVGAIIGNCSIVTSDDDATCSCKLAILRSKKKEITPETLFFFIKSKYGQNQIQKFKRGAAQTGLLLEDFDQLFIPVFSSDFQDKLKEIFEEIKDIIWSAEKLYEDAKVLLERELGFDSYIEPKEVYSVKNFSEVFGVSDRIDAEYYQEKYDRLESILHLYDPNCELLGNIAKYLFTGEYAEEYFNKDTDTRFFIRGTDIKNGYVEADDNYCIYPNQYTKFVRTGDIITGRVGTIGNFGVIDDSLDNSLCSDNILCFHLPEKYIPEVYALYFNLPCVDKMITRLARGSVQQRLNQETLKMVEIPFIPEKKQLVMKAMVEESRSKQILAQELLNRAVQLVELAIEQGEEEALKSLS